MLLTLKRHIAPANWYGTVPTLHFCLGSLLLSSVTAQFPGTTGTDNTRMQIVIIKS
jgi:hypothetical protein